jgi:hypothetical protein
MSTQWQNNGDRRRRSEDNINMNFKETVCEGEHWIQPAQERIQWRALQVP